MTKKHALPPPLDARKVSFPHLCDFLPLLSLILYLRPWRPGTNLRCALARLLSIVSSSMLSIKILNKYNCLGGVVSLSMWTILNCAKNISCHCFDTEGT